MVKRDRVSRISNINYVDAIDSFSITMIIDFNIDLKKVSFFSRSIDFWSEPLEFCLHHVYVLKAIQASSFLVSKKKKQYMKPSL